VVKDYKLTTRNIYHPDATAEMETTYQFKAAGEASGTPTEAWRAYPNV